MPKILAACKKFGIDIAERNATEFGGEDRRTPLRPPFTGEHSHLHSAMGTQGGDETHDHQHSDDGDSDHDHEHVGFAQANAAHRPREARAPLKGHGSTTGTHSHLHPAGSAGSAPHEHSHTHDGDNSHGHTHSAANLAAADAIAAASVKSDSLDTPSAEMPGMPDFGLEARLAILRLKAGPPSRPLTERGRFERPVVEGRAAAERLRKRIAELRKGNRRPTPNESPSSRARWRASTPSRRSFST